VSTKPPETRQAFDLEAPWRLHPQVAIRPERFGALLYHFGTRRLSFVKTPTLLEVVRSLDTHASARAACQAAGVRVEEMPSYQAALATLAKSSMICAGDWQ
jgi:putative mycofactocin binding protein MftB